MPHSPFHEKTVEYYGSIANEATVARYINGGNEVDDESSVDPSKSEALHVAWMYARYAGYTAREIADMLGYHGEVEEDGDFMLWPPSTDPNWREPAVPEDAPLKIRIRIRL